MLNIIKTMRQQQTAHGLRGISSRRHGYAVPVPTVQDAAANAAVFVCLTASGFATAQPVDPEGLEMMTNIFTLLWYFSLFCAWTMGFARGQTR